MAQKLAGRLPSWRRVVALITCLWLGGSVIIPAAARAQEEFTVLITLDSVTLATLGVITVTGTLTCLEPAVVASVSAQVLQPVRRVHTVPGSGFAELEACDVTPRPFEIVVVPWNGRFAPGTTYVTVSGFACTDLTYTRCNGDAITYALRLPPAL
jgi:hypothetical protein